MVRRRDVHRVDVLVLLLEQLAPVLIDANLWEALLQPLEPGQVDVRDGDEIERRDALQTTSKSLSAWPDAPMPACRSTGAAARAGVPTGRGRRPRSRRRSGEIFCVRWKCEALRAAYRHSGAHAIARRCGSMTTGNGCRRVWQLPFNAR